jgi:hypothetical protein
MSGPRDQPSRFAVPVNYETGRELSERQVVHLAAISDAAETLYEAMHFAEGSSPPGEHQEHVFLSRRMAMANSYLEIAVMLARKAALETK